MGFRNGPATRAGPRCSDSRSRSKKERTNTKQQEPTEGDSNHHPNLTVPISTGDYINLHRRLHYRLPRDWRWLLGGFVVYRLFDVWKPYPIGVIEEGFGVGVSIMADDIVAGIYAWCVLHLVHRAMRR